MPVLKGNTSGSITSQVFTNPLKIIGFHLVNKAGGAITVNVFITIGDAVHIIPQNELIQVSGAYIYSGNYILLPDGGTISIVTSGSLDYYFTLENI